MANDRSLVIALIGIVVLAFAFTGIVGNVSGKATIRTITTPCKTYTTEYNSAWHVAWTCAAKDVVKCSAKNMCAYKGVCYSNRAIGVFFPDRIQDQIVICAGDQSNKWFDADGGKSQCGEINTRYPGLVQWATAGEQSVGEYFSDANGGGNFPYECCGDDEGEYPAATGNTAIPHVCCNGANDVAVFENGAWVCKTPYCGDNKINVANEACDGTDFGGKTCQQIPGFIGGTLSCKSDCKIDTTQCLTCTDSDGGYNIYEKGTRQTTTQTYTDFCVDYSSSEYPVLLEYDCNGSYSVNVVEGTGQRGGCTYGCFNARCLTTRYNITCTDPDKSYWDRYTKGTTRSTIMQTGEFSEMQDRCQDDAVIEYSCRSNGYLNLEVKDCSLGCVDGACNVPSCGDGIRTYEEVDVYEDCDGSDFGDRTCEGLGFNGGELTCTNNCEIDTSGCINSVCGDGIIDGNEACDGNNLGGNTCADFPGYSSGVLGCTPDCKYDFIACNQQICGNGIIEPPETCEGYGVIGSCAGLGPYTDGNVTCNAATCTYDYSWCWQ